MHQTFDLVATYFTNAQYISFTYCEDFIALDLFPELN